MAKLTRKTQKVFGSTAGVNQIAQIGSLAAAAPAYSTDPDTIQALSNYLAGWFSVVVGSNSPAIEDMNALCYLFARQLAYVFQNGVAEYDSATTYYTGSFASDSVGNVYTSIVDTNLGNALTDTTKWRMFTGSVIPLNPATQSPYVLTSLVNRCLFHVTTANGAQQITLPAAVNGYRFIVKDVSGYAATYNITIARAASESIEGLAVSYACKADYGSWQFVCDGTNWWLV